MGKNIQLWKGDSKRLDTVLKAVQVNCLDCAGAEIDRRYCSALDCPLWPFRFGNREVESRLLDKRNFAEGAVFDINLEVEKIARNEQAIGSENEPKLNVLKKFRKIAPDSLASNRETPSGPDDDTDEANV